MFYLIGITSFLLSIIISILVLFFTFKIFKLISRININKDIVNGNIAVAIHISGYLIAFGILMVKSLYPVSTTLQELFTNDITIQRIMSSAGYIVLYFVVSYILSLITIIISAFIFQFLTTKINEIELIRNNNIAVAIVLSCVVITTAIMTQSGLSFLINTLIPQSPCC